MGDSLKPAKNANPAFDFLSFGFRTDSDASGKLICLNNELFVQIMKQLSLNPSEASVEKGWKMVILNT
jgi:hypothetical protein